MPRQGRGVEVSRYLFLSGMGESLGLGRGGGGVFKGKGCT